MAICRQEERARKTGCGNQTTRMLVQEGCHDVARDVTRIRPQAATDADPRGDHEMATLDDKRLLKRLEDEGAVAQLTNEEVSVCDPSLDGGISSSDRAERLYEGLDWQSLVVDNRKTV